MPDDQQAKRATPSRQNHAVTLIVPYPPSVNRYWRRLGNRTILSRAAREFRSRVKDLWYVQKWVYRRESLGSALVQVSLMIHPPDNRRRDLDNVLKAALDAIEAAGIIEDDSQVRRLELAFGDCVDGGSVTITVKAMPCDTQ